jgi:hypothetical protein
MLYVEDADGRYSAWPTISPELNFGQLEAERASPQLKGLDSSQDNALIPS